MYLPSPLRTIVTAIRQRSAERTALHEFKSTADVLSQSGEFGPVYRAINRMLSPVSSLHEKAAIRQVVQRRRELAASTASFEDIGYGSGYADSFSPEQQRAGVRQTISVKEATSWTQGPIEGSFLFYLVRELAPNRVLEMGSCIGISGSFLASALNLNGRGRLLTLEGSPGSSAIARETFSVLGLTNYAQVRTGPFYETLTEALAEGPYDLVFIDGHHDGTATLNYFDQIKPHLATGAIVVFDDIDWSEGMALAWRKISGSVPTSCHIAALGIICYG